MRCAPTAAPRGAARCRLAVVDVRAGAVVRTHGLCAEGEAITGLAAERTPTGTVAYAALWRPAQAAGAAPGAAGSVGSADGGRVGARVVVIDVATGAWVGATRLSGQPRPIHAGGSLLLAPFLPGLGSPEGTAPRLYVVEAPPGPIWATWNEEEYAWMYRLAASWRLTRLTPDRLAVESFLPLDFAPSGLAVSPDGAHAYAFDVMDDRPVEVALATGRTRVLASVPGSGAVPAGLAVSAERVYAAVPRRNEVWAFDRHTGRRVLTLDVGRFPVAVVPAALRAREPEASA